MQAPDDALRLAQRCIDACALGDRVTVHLEDGPPTLVFAGPDQFAMMGTVAYVSVRVRLPASPREVALAAARHVLEEFHANASEITRRAAELPLFLVTLLESPETS